MLIGHDLLVWCLILICRIWIKTTTSLNPTLKRLSKKSSRITKRRCRNKKTRTSLSIRSFAHSGLKAIMVAKLFEGITMPHQRLLTMHMHQPLRIDIMQEHKSHVKERPSMLIEAVFIKSFFNESNRGVKVELRVDRSIERGSFFSRYSSKHEIFGSYTNIFPCVRYPNRAHRNQPNSISLKLHCLFWHSGGSSILPEQDLVT